MSDKLPIPSHSYASPQAPVGFRPSTLSNKRLGLALAIAVTADVVGAFLTLTPMVWGVDLVTAILLFMVLGWNWLLLPGIIMEAIPGVSVMPLWVLVVAAIAIWGTARPKLQR